MVFMTLLDAEEIIASAQIGMYNLDYPGNRSKLAHACLLIDGLALQEEAGEEEKDEHKVEHAAVSGGAFSR